MKLVVAAQGSQVARHFGHCESFVFFDVEDGRITGQTRVENPGHKPGFLPNFLADHGAQVIVSGGMGGGAVDIFQERGVQVIVGIEGDVQETAIRFAHGELESTGEVCHEHEAEHDGACK